jgi:tetratricopeptide (TPR) repeat protein
MLAIYKVILEPEGKEKLFRVTWHNLENNSQYCSIRESEITPEEIKWLWQIPLYQLEIGQKLFRFLDGDAHHFQQALNRANLQGEILQVYLRTCKQTSDWPFELLATDRAFLLPKQVHLVRYVSEWGIGKVISPENRPLKLLFMACSALDVEPELDFEQEEETIFKITEKFAIDMEVEDSGSLEGLRNKLVQEQYDVVHLSGHAGIGKNGRPFFIMEDEMGYIHQVFPDELWNESLIEHPPRLLFLSGCRTGEAPESDRKPESIAEASFARLLFENYHVPAVLGWGRSVSDKQASHAGKIIFKELSRGKSILDAVQRARNELIKNFPDSDKDKPTWPLLRLFSSGIPLNPIVEKEQHQKPKPRRMKHIYLKNSRVKVLIEGFVGRRRQLQTGLRALKQDYDKVGLLLMGTGGLGKSCLAGKICERFRNHTLIIVHGRFNTITIELALTDAFIISQDEKGQEILSRDIEMTDKLAHLCVTSFKEKNYLFLLDDFEQNLEGVDKGQPWPLLPEAADLLNALLCHLPKSGKMTQLVITSRYEFSLVENNRNLVTDRLEKVWLTSFQETEQRKKARQLPNILKYEDQSKVPELLAAGHGNPRLMEWLNVLVGQMISVEVARLLEAVKDRQEDFIRVHVIRELLQRGSRKLELLLHWLSIYRRPVLEDGVRHVSKKAGLEGWNELLSEGMGLSLVEYDQVRQSYRVTPLLQEELLKGIKEHKACHEAAFAYYRQLCETRDSFDPILAEEWIFHALGCGEEMLASQQGAKLVIHLRERLALQESRRVGEWILSEKKRKCSTQDDAFLINAIGYTINEQGQHQQAIEYFQQAAAIFQGVNGTEHLNVVVSLINQSSACTALGNFREAINYSQQALDMAKSIYGENHPTVLAASSNLGSIYLYLGDHDKANKYLEQSLSINNSIWSESNPIAARVINNIASVYLTLGEHRKAVIYLEKALSIDREVFGAEHPDVARELNNLGEAYRALGEPKKAIAYYEQALNVFNKVYGENHPNVATALNNLSGAWYDLGDYRRSIDYLEQALSIEGLFYGDEHPNVARCLSNLGESWRAKGEPGKAGEYFERALTIWKKVYGENHPNVALTLNNLGEVWDDLGDYDKANEYLQQALIILKNTYGNNHPQTAILLNNLGESRRALGHPEKAIEYLEQALSINRSVYGEEHPEVVTVLNNLGLAWGDLGEFEKAIGYYEESLVIFEKVYRDKHPKKVIILGNLGDAYRGLGEAEKAVSYYENALNTWRNFGEDKNKDIINIINNYGLALYESGDYKGAIEYFERALSIGRQVKGEEHPDLVTFLNNLGMAWDALGEFEKAIDYYDQSMVILKKIYGEDQPQVEVAIVLNQLGESWGNLGETKKAIEYFEEALKIWRELNEYKNPYVIQILNNLGLVWSWLEDHNKAIEYFEQVLSIDLELYGEEHPDVARDLNNLGFIWSALGEFIKAIDYYGQALSIDQSVHGEEHPDVARDLNNLGSLYFQIGQQEQAKNCFKKAYDILHQSLGPEHPDTKEVCECLNTFQ